METPAPVDKIFLRNIAINATVGVDCWQRSKPQSALIDLIMYTTVAAAGAGDDISKSINYSSVYKAVVDKVHDSKHGDLLAFTKDVGVHALRASHCQFVDVTVLFPKGILHAEGLGLNLSMTCSTNHEHDQGFVSTRCNLFVKNLRLSCYLGINPHERLHKQPVIVNLEYSILHKSSEPHVADWQSYIDPVVKLVEDSSYFTVEALVSAVASMALEDQGVTSVKVMVEKPAAYGGPQCPGVEVVRYRD